MNNSIRLYASEFLGTFFLVFAATGVVIVNDLSGGAITHTGIAITTGLVVMAIVYAVGDVSGSHINPAVTVGFWLAGRFPGYRVIQYIISQCLGAIAASLLLAFLFPELIALTVTNPSGPIMQSFILEIVITLFLMFIILSVSTGSMEKGIMAGSAIGGVVGLTVLWAGPITGASMNPARSIAPALVSLDFASLWIYIAGPIIGAALSVIAFRIIHKPLTTGLEGKDF
ncbi:MAG: aquaporin [Thermodesulfobacteriota bacterium]